MKACASPRASSSASAEEKSDEPAEYFSLFRNPQCRFPIVKVRVNWNGWLTATWMRLRHPRHWIRGSEPVGASQHQPRGRSDET